MANSSLGIYIDNNLIKYAKIQKDKENYKIEAFNVVFYDNLEREIDKIVSETGSSKIPICINLSNEMYNYFDVISMMNKKDRAQCVKMEFETFCEEKGLNSSDYESRYLTKESDNNSDKLTAIYVSTEKKEISKLADIFAAKKVASIRPITTSIINLLDINEKENVVIVNLENKTRVTTIIGGMIGEINTLSVGMKEILGAINETENSMQKSYEVCKNTTIYTQGAPGYEEDEGNEHLEEIMPILYNIVQETKLLIENGNSIIHKVYITGLGSAINNIELYFQEHLVNSKVEILKPFFLENTSINSSFKDYIEVNSAIGLALDELGDCVVGDEFNFKKGSGINFDPKGFMKNSPEVNMDMSGPLEPSEKVMLRISAILAIVIIVYMIFTNAIVGNIEDMKADADSQIASTKSEIAKAESDAKIIKEQADYYAQISEVIKKVISGTEEALSSVPAIEARSVPRLMRLIKQEIPGEVVMLSIKNTTEKHIVMEVVAPMYDQIGELKAVLNLSAELQNVKSSSGQKVGGYSNDMYPDDWIYVTIEGDLP